jgi:hypothetical protein
MHEGWINNHGTSVGVVNLFLLVVIMAAFWVLPDWVAILIGVIGVSHMISHGLVGPLWKAPQSDHDWD